MYSVSEIPHTQTVRAQGRMITRAKAAFAPAFTDWVREKSSVAQLSSINFGGDGSYQLQITKAKF